MPKSLKVTLLLCVILLSFIVSGSYSRQLRSQPIVGSVLTGVHYLVNGPDPCERPITYSIGTFDPKFNIEQHEVLADLVKAIAIWEQPTGKKLFQLVPNGDLKINFIYDYRQNATDNMQSINKTITASKSSYEALKAQYDLLLRRYNQQHTELTQKISLYEKSRKEYQKDVAFWNTKGGAPRDQFQIFEARRASLNAEAESLNGQQKNLNSLADQLNSAASELNRIAKELNINVQSYNMIGASTGLEFEEGEYIRDQDGQRINIYQFEDKTKLIRVLAHELGHAIGLDHVEDEEAIMYHFNLSQDRILTEADVEELRRICGSDHE